MNTELNKPNKKTFVLPTLGERIKCNETQNTYEIGRKIGEGEFGLVYACVDSWGNELAVKILKPRGTYVDIKNSCLSERNKLLMFRHPYITYVHDVFEYRDTFYIVTERCSSTLKDMMHTKGFDGRVWLKAIAHCILQAVHSLHTKGYLHQDLHAGNIFSTFVKDELLPDDRSIIQFKVGDVGISRLIEEVTSESTMMDWMRPPEMLSPEKFGKPDNRVDIYHLGLLFLQLLLGGDIRFSHEEILAGRPGDIARSLNIPEGNVIAKALSPNVKERQSSAMQLWDELKHVLPQK